MSKRRQEFRAWLATGPEPFWIKWGIFGYVGPHHFGDGDFVSREALSRAVCERAGRRLSRLAGLALMPLLIYALSDSKWNALDAYSAFLALYPLLQGTVRLFDQVKEPEAAHASGALHFLAHSPRRRSARRDVMKILPSLLPGIQRRDDLSPGSWRDLLEIALRSRNAALRVAVLDAMRRADAPELTELVESRYSLTDVTSKKLDHAEASAVAAARYALRSRSVIQAEAGGYSGVYQPCSVAGQDSGSWAQSRIASESAPPNHVGDQGA